MNQSTDRSVSQSTVPSIIRLPLQHQLKVRTKYLSIFNPAIQPRRPSLKQLLHRTPRSESVLARKSITTRIMTTCPNHNCRYNNISPTVMKTIKEDGSVSIWIRNQDCLRCGRELPVTKGTRMPHAPVSTASSVGTCAGQTREEKAE